MFYDLILFRSSSCRHAHLDVSDDDAIFFIAGNALVLTGVIGFIAFDKKEAEEKVKLLISLGQIVIIWVGGGTLIPWSVVPVASACGVTPRELVKKNFVPVVCGLAAATIAASVWLVIL